MITLVSHVTYILIMQRMNLISALSCMARYCFKGGLGTDDMPEDRVIDNRACRESLPAKNIPMLVGPLADLDSWIQCSSQHPLRFTVKNGGGQQGVGLILIFFKCIISGILYIGNFILRMNLFIVLVL